MRRSTINKDLFVTDDLDVVVIMRLLETKNEDHAFLIIESINSIQRIELFLHSSPERKKKNHTLISIKNNPIINLDETQLNKVIEKIFNSKPSDKWIYLAWNITKAQTQQLEADIAQDKKEDSIIYAELGDKSAIHKSYTSDSTTKVHSCFTWAREKLLNLEKDLKEEEKIISKRLNPGFTDWICAKTSLYMPNPNTYWYHDPRKIAGLIGSTVIGSVMVAKMLGSSSSDVPSMSDIPTITTKIFKI